MMKNQKQNQMKVAVANLSKKYWTNRQGCASSFSSTSAAYGIINDQGQALSRDGEAPCVWNKKSIVAKMAPYASDFKNHVWINIYDSRNAATAHIDWMQEAVTSFAAIKYAKENSCAGEEARKAALESLGWHD